jgi:hypothetical protein
MENKQGTVDWLIKLYQQTGKIDIFDLEVAKEIEKEQSEKIRTDAILNYKCKYCGGEDKGQ